MSGHFGGRPGHYRRLHDVVTSASASILVIDKNVALLYMYGICTIIYCICSIMYAMFSAVAFNIIISTLSNDIAPCDEAISRELGLTYF